MSAVRCAGGGRQRGVALIIVLWVGALVTMMAAAFAFTARTESLLATQQAERAQAEALAEAGIRRFIVWLAAARTEDPPQADGRPYRVALPGGSVRVRLYSENGKVDLNAAPPELLEGLVHAALDRLPDPGETDPEAVVDAMLDWRDADHDTRPQGAEDKEYEDAGRSYTARDQAFVSVSELRRVLGMTAPLYEQIAPGATVYTSSGQIDPMTAPPIALLAVPGLDAARVESFLEARAELLDSPSPGAPDAAVLQLLSGAERYLSRPRASIFTVDARGETAAGTAVRRRAVVRVTGSPREPYSVLAWLDTGPEEDTAEGDSESSPPGDVTPP